MRLISREVHTMDEKKQNDQIQLFENQKIRTAWDAEQEEWYFSVVDVVGALTDQSTPRRGAGSTPSSPTRSAGPGPA